jgi:hypothetical protein
MFEYSFRSPSPTVAGVVEIACIVVAIAVVSLNSRKRGAEIVSLLSVGSPKATGKLLVRLSLTPFLHLHARKTSYETDQRPLAFTMRFWGIAT